MRRMYVVGNWKMHGLSADIAEIQAIADGARDYPNVDGALCVPATLIERAARAVPMRFVGAFPHPDFRIGAQDLHQEYQGAYTGCISASMLLDAGASLTIVGHSERRQGQCETDADVRAKASMAIAAGLWTIVCIGETLEVRDTGDAVAAVCRQLDASLPAYDDLIWTHLAIAYEPIWAIGTGKVASPADIGEMHAAIRQRLIAAYGDAGSDIRILYGGSVKASNAAEIFAVDDVDGALVGGASLKASDFLPIVEAAARGG